MLSLIPALLLLALHGPAAVERYGHEGRLPEALRALERVWTPLAQESADSGVSKQCRALASLAALTADPIFSKAVSELLGWDAAPADRAMPPDPSPAKSSVFVTSSPACDGLPVFGMVRPLSAGLFFTDGGVSPLGICHAISPLFMSYAAISHVQYRLAQQGPRTRLTLIHRAIGEISPEHREGANQGWQHMLAGMKSRAEKKKS